MKNKEPNFGWNKTIEELAKSSKPINAKNNQKIYMKNIKNEKENKLPIREVRAILPKVVNALENCMNWMEQLRASGDAGSWEWDNDDEYTKAQEVLNELRINSK